MKDCSNGGGLNIPERCCFLGGMLVYLGEGKMSTMVDDTGAACATRCETL
jgi:hypothetical protein